MPVIARNQLLTSHEVGSLLQMDPSSVVKWVNDGILPAYRTPGGHRRIRAMDLLAFLRHHDMYVPSALTAQVLVVDGDADALRALARSAKGHEDFTVTTCASAIDGLVHIGAMRPDLVVLAPELPEANGLQILRALKAAERTRDLPVVIAAEAPTPALQKAAHAAGATVIEKPLNAARLAELLGTAVPAR